jgi:hypothetical protein
MKVSDSMGEFENWNRFLKQTLGEKYKGQQSDRNRGKPPRKQSKGSEQVEQEKDSIRKDL